MATPTQNMLMEAIAAARAGDRLRARDLFARLLRADSGNAEYWIWMSSLVDTKREKVYCLESALNLDPTNRAARRGLVILGARQPEEADLASAVRIPRRQVASIAKGPSVRRGLSLGKLGVRWRWVAAGVVGLVLITSSVAVALSLFRPRRLAVAPTLPPVTPTSTATPMASPTPTATETLPPNILILRTAIPTELAGTPIIFFVAATPTPTPVLGVTPHPNIEAYSAGITALTRGDYETALNFMEQVLKLDDTLPDAHYFRAEALRLLAENAEDNPGIEASELWGDALGAYDRAVLLNSDFAPAYLGRGRVTLQRMLPLRNENDLKLDDLPLDFDRAIERDPTLVQAYLEKVTFLARLRLWKTMEEMLQGAIDAGVRHPLLLIRLSEAQINRERFEMALQNAIEGSLGDPTQLDGYLMVGRAFVRVGQYEEALPHLQTYIMYEPEDFRGWSELGKALLEIGDWEGSSHALNRTLEINPQYGRAHLARGWLFLQLGDFESSVKDFRDAKQFGVESYDLSLGLGTALYQLGVLKEALQHINRAIEIGNQETKRAELELKVAEGYAIRALIYEQNPDLIQDAIKNWEWILSFTNVRPETRALAEAHLLELTGSVPTQIPSGTLQVSPSPTPPAGTPQAPQTPAPSDTPEVIPTA